MKTPTKSFLTAAAVAALTIASAGAQTIVTEFFDYSNSANSSVSGLSGGTNWTNNWSVNGTANGNFQTTNLSYTGATGYVNPTVSNNGSIGLTWTNDTGFYASNHENRSFNPTGSSIIWMSYLVRLDSAVNNQQAFMMFGDVNYRIAVRGIGSNTIRVGGVYSGTETTIKDFTGGSGVGQTLLILARLSIDSGGNDSYKVWLNPTDVTSLTALGSANYTSSSTQNFYNTGDFNLRVGFRSPAGASSAFIDNIRIAYGSATDEALMLAVVPEPTTWAMLAGGLTALVVFRKRRRA